MLEPGSFDACKNDTTSMIVMLGHSEVDTKVSDASMKTTESDDCKKVLRDNRDANEMLATVQERTRFFCKDK